MWCQELDGSDHCAVADIRGKLEYEGDSALYPDKKLVPNSQLNINAIKTRENKVWVDDALVPIVYL
jgi:hypothetical protein